MSTDKLKKRITVIFILLPIQLIFAGMFFVLDYFTGGSDFAYTTTYWYIVYFALLVACILTVIIFVWIVKVMKDNKLRKIAPSLKLGMPSLIIAVGYTVFFFYIMFFANIL